MNFQTRINHTAEFEPQMITVKGKDITRGHLIVVKGERRTVTRVVVKVKNVEVSHMPEGFTGYDPTHPTVTYRVDHDYAVIRLAETTASQKQSARKMRLESLHWHYDNAVAKRAETKEEFDKRFESGDITQWMYDGLVEADADHSVFSYWKSTVDNIAARIAEGEIWENMPADALEVAERLAENYQDQVMLTVRRPLSRNTAVLGNLVEDVMAAAKVKFIEAAQGRNIWG